LDYKGRGVTQEINILDIDGERLRGWADILSLKESLHFRNFLKTWK
tara:strand:+ start:76 stop:213 length:138 start_codon:yes stop_codon:yes gene_type:complete